MRVLLSQVPGSRTDTYTGIFQRPWSTAALGRSGHSGHKANEKGMSFCSNPGTATILGAAHPSPCPKWGRRFTWIIKQLCVQIYFYSTQFGTSRLQYDTENLKLTFICLLGQAWVHVYVPAGSAPGSWLWIWSGMMHNNKQFVCFVSPYLLPLTSSWFSAVFVAFWCTIFQHHFSFPSKCPTEYYILAKFLIQNPLGYSSNDASRQNCFSFQSWGIIMIKVYSFI